MISFGLGTGSAHSKIFSPYRLDLTPRRDGKFDLIFRQHERNGLGAGITERAIRAPGTRLSGGEFRVGQGSL